MVCGTPSLCGKERARGALRERFENGGHKPSSEATSRPLWPKLCWRGGTGGALAVRTQRCSLFSPAVAREAGQRGSRDGAAAGLGRGSSTSPATESLGHDSEAPQQLANLGNHPPDGSLVGSGLSPRWWLTPGLPKHRLRVSARASRSSPLSSVECPGVL